MAKGNRDFANLLTGSLTDASVEATPVPDLAAMRDSSLSKMARGSVVNTRVELVDPARCKPWVYSDRDRTLLNEQECADLIDSYKATGRQQLPALVRRLKDDPAHDFEIIYGNRRHWAALWMQQNGHPDFKFLVTIKNLTDAEAFIESDIENRTRKDLSDLERAKKYRQSLEIFFRGDQKGMAGSLGISESTLSRLLSLAELPSEVIGAFEHPYDIKATYAVTLSPLLNNPASRRSLIELANEITSEQEVARREGRPLQNGPAVLARLKSAKEKVKKTKKRDQKLQPFTTKEGAKFLEAERVRGGGLRIQVYSKTGASRQEFLDAFAKLLEDLPDS
ncbi:MAG TPA: ParB/RepB/Spo0J family partition protein [Pedomonas sp.]|uniref:ParB/RepB/Spo0J family partition protein n=1 Tax=Pedomonas sp. TaxID=2976421 RepID=UPI002F3F28E4